VYQIKSNYFLFKLNNYNFKDNKSIYILLNKIYILYTHISSDSFTTFFNILVILYSVFHLFFSNFLFIYKNKEGKFNKNF